METTRTARPSRSEALGGGEGQGHLRAGGEQEELQLDAGPRLPEDVSASFDPGIGTLRVAARTGSFWRVRASAVGPLRRSIARRQAATVSRASAGRKVTSPGIARSEASWLDRLMGRAVLAEEDRVVGEDVDRRQPHQGGEPDRRAHVVREDQEGPAVGAEAPRQRQAIQDRAHGVLAHAEVEVAAAGGGGREERLPLRPGCCSTRRGRPSRRRAPASREASAQQSPCRRRRAWRPAFRRRRSAAAPPASPREAPRRAGGRAPPRAPDALRDRRHAACPTPAAARRHARPRRDKAPGLRRERGMSPLRASRSARLVARAASAPSGAPCDSAESCFGLPKPMWVRTTTNVGRALSLSAARKARSSSARSLPSSTVSTCQP